MKKALSLFLILLLYSCSNHDCREQAFSYLDKHIREVLQKDEKAHVADKNVVYATDSVCIIYYTFRDYENEEKMEFGYVIFPNGLKGEYNNIQGNILIRCDNIFNMIPNKTEKDKEHILGYLIGNNGFEIK